MSNNWDALGAIGQILGAGATFWAVLMALRINRGKAIITLSFTKGELKEEDRIKIHVVNDGRGMLKLKSMGFNIVGSNKDYPLTSSYLPKILEPNDDFDFPAFPKSMAKILYKDKAISEAIVMMYFYDSHSHKSHSKSFFLDIRDYLKEIYIDI